MRLLIACFPKSGSSYLNALIGSLPTFKSEYYVPGYARREQELCEHTIGMCSGENQVAQLHVRCTEHTLRVISLFDITPIVLVRNVFDAIVSLADHVASEGHAIPMAYLDERIAKLPIDERIGALVDLAAPWYFNFYASWWQAKPDAIVTYEDVILGGVPRQSELLREFGIHVTDNDVAGAAARVTHQMARFNVGKAGRGLELVNGRHRERIQRLADYYPAIDFAPIGL